MPLETKLKTIRVGILDDHPMVREGLGSVVDKMPEAELSFSTASEDEAMRLIQQDTPDVLLLDVALGSCSGLDLIERLIEISPRLRVVVLTVADDPSYVIKAISAGACGYLLKGCERDQITSAIVAASQGVATIAPLELLSGMFHDWRHHTTAKPTEGPDSILSERELEILKLVAAGHSNREIARKLILAESTVKKYSHNAMGKLGVPNRGAASIRAIRMGLINLEDDEEQEVEAEPLTP